MHNKFLIIGIMVVLLFLTIFFISHQEDTTNHKETIHPNNFQEKKDTPYTIEHTIPKKQTSEKVQKEIIKTKPSISSLYALMHCEKTATCPEDNSDPRASYFLKSKQMLEKIKQIEEAYLEAKISKKELQEVALELLTYPDGAIKEESLRLLSKIPPHQNIQTSVLKMFSHTYDAKLVTPVLLELSRYPHSQKIDTIFKEILTHGGFYIAQELANAISPFIHQENIHFYEEIKNNLPLNSKRRVHLQTSILEAKIKLD